MCFLGGVKGFGSVQYFLLKQKIHEDSRPQLSDIKKELEKYIGKLESTILDSKIKFSVNIVFRKNKKNKKRRHATRRNPNLILCNLPPAPIFDSETGEKLED